MFVNEYLAIANKSRVKAAHAIYRGHLCDLEIYVKGQIIHDLLLDELLYVDYYRDLEMWVRGHLMSLK